MTDKDDMDGWVDGGRGSSVGDFKVYDFVLEPVSSVRHGRYSHGRVIMPFFEFGYAFVQVPACVELWVLDLLNGDFG